MISNDTSIRILPEGDFPRKTTIRLQFQWKNYETTIRNYFAARRHLCLGRYDGLQTNLSLLPSPFSKEKLSRSPSITTSQVLQIFRWLIATINDVSNVQPKLRVTSLGTAAASVG